MPYYVHCKLNQYFLVGVCFYPILSPLNDTLMSLCKYMVESFAVVTCFSPNQLTTLGLHMQNSILIKEAYFIGIHKRKKSMILVLISNKSSETINKLGIIFRHRCQSLFSLELED